MTRYPPPPPIPPTLYGARATPIAVQPKVAGKPAHINAPPSPRAVVMPVPPTTYASHATAPAVQPKIADARNRHVPPPLPVPTAHPRHVPPPPRGMAPPAPVPMRTPPNGGAVQRHPANPVQRRHAHPPPPVPPVGAPAHGRNPSLVAPTNRHALPHPVAQLMPRPPVRSPVPPIGVPLRVSAVQGGGAIQRAAKLFDREPTFYTYMQTDPLNDLSKANQGPHTLSFALVNLLVESQTRSKNLLDLQALFQQQVPSVVDMKQIVDEELDGSSLAKKAEKANRFHVDYKNLYEDIEGDIKNGSKFNPLSKKIRKIMEMHPYGTYAYKNQNGASKKARKGKGEGSILNQIRRRNFLKAKGLIDTSYAKYKHKDRLEKYLKTRLSMVYTSKEIKDHFKVGI